MRLLLNENFPAPSVQRLRHVGIDLIAIAESHPGMPDPDVLNLAVSQQRWLVTFDRDYGELVFARRLPSPPSVILFRSASYRPEDPAEWLLSLLRNPEECLGKFVVSDGQTSRTRPLLSAVAYGSG